MGITTIWPAFLITGVGVIVLFYFFKPKGKKYQVSTLLFLKENQKREETSRTIEQFRKNILLFFQILIWIFLLLALLGPYFINNEGKEQEVFLILDNSGSMKTLFQEEKTRLQVAKEAAEKCVEELPEKTKVTLIQCGKEAAILMSHSTNRKEIIEKIKEIPETDLEGNASLALPLLDSLKAQSEQYEAIFYTDTVLELKDLSGEVHSFYSDVENASILSVSHRMEERGLMLLVQVKNYGKKKFESELNLYGDNKILDVQKLNLEPMESQELYLGPYPFNGKIIKAELQEKDALIVDNTAWDLLEEEKQNRGLLITKSNLFLEKALKLSGDLELYKTEDAESVQESDRYDFVIYDGIKPKQVPKGAGLLLINMEETDFLLAEGKEEGKMLRFENTSLTKYFVGTEIGSNQIFYYKKPKWADVFLTMGEKAVGFYGIQDGKRICVVGFDFHSSDFPLLAEFPIFIQEITDFLTSRSFIEKRKVIAGTSVAVQTGLSKSDIKIQGARGEEKKLQTLAGQLFCNDTAQAGVYTVTQKEKKQTRTEKFIVEFPTGESKVEGASNIKNQKEQESILSNRTQGLKELSIMLALLLLVIEWFFYVKRQ